MCIGGKSQKQKKRKRHIHQAYQQIDDEEKRNSTIVGLLTKLNPGKDKCSRIFMHRKYIESRYSLVFLSAL